MENLTEDKKDTPQGFKCLLGIDHVFVEQRVESLEFLVGNSQANQYAIKDANGQIIMNAVEFSNAFARLLIGKSRAFELKLLSNEGDELMSSDRRYTCDLFACCFARCTQQMLMTSRNGQENNGSIVQSYSCKGTMFSVLDDQGEIVFHIRPPQKLIVLSRDGWVFDILDATGMTVLGEIRKKWKGIISEMFTSADNFGVSFPADMDPMHKAILINVCVLIDFIYFEKE